MQFLEGVVVEALIAQIEDKIGAQIGEIAFQGRVVVEKPDTYASVWIDIRGALALVNTLPYGSAHEAVGQKFFETP